MDFRLNENLSNMQHNNIAPFLWLHGESDELIIRELDRIYESGIRSVCLESRTHEDFVRDGWWSNLKAIFEHCRKLGMNVWILDDKHFPSGYANGIFVEKYKNLRPWCITEQHMDIAGPVTDGAAMADCWLECDDDEILAAVALRHIPNSDSYSEALDISGGLSDGMVYFTLPEGMWRIVLLIKSRRGLTDYYRGFCDLLNKETVELFIDEVYEPHYAHFKEYFGNIFSGFFSDEPGFRNGSANGIWNANFGMPFIFQPWSDGVKREFERLFGAEAFAYLCGLWFNTGAMSRKARYAFMDYVSKQYRDNFCNTIAAWCHEHGVSYIGHVIEDNNCHSQTTYGTGHYFRALGGQDMSGVDVVLHQLVPGLTECANAGLVSYKHMNSNFFHYILAKLGSSLSHIDAKKHGRAMCEIFGAYGWAEGTKIMKYLMDHMLVRGINYFVPHAFSPKLNDTDCPPNFYDSGRNPQYKFFKRHMDYLNRMSHLLSGGVHHSTCAILYDAEFRWTNGEYLHEEDIAKVLYDNLLDYDIIPSDCIDEIAENGYLNGEKYNAILVPDSDYIPPEVAKKLDECKVKTIVVSKEDKTGCVSLSYLAAYMTENGYRDVRADYDGIFLRYCHYERNGAHFYMFSNEDANNVIKTNVRLMGFGGGGYIEYDAYENTAVRKTSSQGSVEIELYPYNSVVIITGDVPFDKVKAAADCRRAEYEPVSAEYDVFLAESTSDNFVPYRLTSDLFSVTSADNLPRFSGTMRYDFEVDIKNSDAVMDFGFVGETAELYVNGKYVGTKTYPPYVFDISEFAVEGINKFRMYVTNHNGYIRRDAFSKYLLFEPSGLIGPVRVGYRINNERGNKNV